MSDKNTEMRLLYEPLAIESRAMGADDKKKKNVVRGYALLWDKAYDMGWFTEVISRGALDGADMDDVVALFNHDKNIVLGRSSAKTLTLKSDQKGLLYEIELPESPNGENVATAIERGDVRASSWQFTVMDAKWDVKDGKDYRSITKISKVYDVSPVTFPANPDTTVAKRSREAANPDDETEIFKERRTNIIQSAQVAEAIAETLAYNNN